MMCDTFPDLLTAYFGEHLHGRACFRVQTNVAKQWLKTLASTPTRSQLLERHKVKGHGHYAHGCAQANAELTLLRAACRWGIYTERWQGGDPTVGIKKWKKRRTRVSKFEDPCRSSTAHTAMSTRTGRGERAELYSFSRQEP
jgi:hypothetical protein